MSRQQVAGMSTVGLPALDGWYTFREVGHRSGTTRSAVWHAHRAGRLESRRDPESGWVVSVSSANVFTREASARRVRVAARREAAKLSVSPKRTWNADPLLQAVDLRGGPTACGARQGTAAEEALRLARLYGRVTPEAGEQLAVGLLGVHPMELWGDTVLV